MEDGGAMDSDDLNTVHHRVVDEQAIIDTAIRYTWALDENDWARLDDVFVPDATARLGDDVTLEGRDSIVGKCSGALSPLAASQHLVGNHHVVVDGDTATHRCYLQAQHVGTKDAGGGLWMVGGRYEDRMVRTDDGWRIQHRDLTVMWTEGDRSLVIPK